MTRLNSAEPRHRIVVTGMGVLTANARNAGEFAAALRAGTSGIKDVSLFDASAYAFPYMGEIEGFRGEDDGLDRASQLALAAAKAAVQEAGEQWIEAHHGRTGVILGTTCGGVTSHEDVMRKWAMEAAASLEEIDEIPFHVMSVHVARRLRLGGPVATVTIACASGANAIGLAADLIRTGQADMMLAGGSDTVSQFTFSGFSILKAMARDACRPFDKNRSGIALGEGAGVVVLESYEQAAKRGAPIYAEILGHGFCNDAYHSTAPDPEGGGMAKSIRHALKRAGLRPEDVDYINAHGTGTPANDVMECNAYKRVFAGRMRTVPVSSTKSMIGHTLGAAGAIELIAGILALQGGFAPPTINYATPDALCDLDVVPNQSRHLPLRHVLSCNAGFGGHNAAVVIGKGGHR